MYISLLLFILSMSDKLVTIQTKYWYYTKWLLILGSMVLWLSRCEYNTILVTLWLLCVILYRTWNKGF